jgi:arylsulfatase A-like enzyme
MNVRRVMVNLLAASLISGLALLSAAQEDVARPNIVLFYTDDQPYHAMGHVEPYFHTPHIDRLAERGVSFANSFVTTAVCAVSRADILTGQHMKRHGIESFDDPLSREQMRKSFPGVLRDSGYRTAFLGKFAIGHPRSAPRELCLPEDQFDLWYGFIQALSYSQEVDGENRYVTTVMEEKAISFMGDESRDEPFLLYMSLPEPHGQGGRGSPWNYQDPEFEVEPLLGPYPQPKTMTRESYESRPRAIRDSRNGPMKENDERFQEIMETRRAYIARADLAVGRIMEALEELGLADNTVVIFTSDHGSQWGAHGLRGKWNMYEESIRAPLIVLDPRMENPGPDRRDQMALSIDLGPTILAMAGAPVPEGMQGMDLGPILRSPDEPGRQDWYYEHDVGSASTGRPLARCEGVRTERWKYIFYKDTEEEELFDLKNDSYEEHNLVEAEEHQSILAHLRERLEHYREALK